MKSVSLHLLLSCLIVCSLPKLTSAQTPSISSGDQNNAVSTDFVKQVMSFGNQDIQLWIEKQPEGLPIELPQLENAHVVGSVSSKGNRLESLTIYLNASQPAQNIRTFYQTHLQKKGWRQITFPDPPIVLKKLEPQRRANESKSLLFCNSSRGTALSITTHPIADSSTDVQLSLTPGKSSGFCQTDQEEKRLDEEMSKQMVTLLKDQLEKQFKLLVVAAPVSSKIFPLGDGFFSDLLLRTPLEPELLIEHYQSQMQMAGWKYQNTGRDRNLSWSTWTSVGARGSTQIALLTIVEEPGLPETNLFLRNNAVLPGLEPTQIASISAALPIRKSRQYLVSRSLFDLNDNQPTSPPQTTPSAVKLFNDNTSNQNPPTIPLNLALRFLNQSSEAKLFPNQLPPQMPTSFPLPPAAQLVGSWINDEGHTMLLLDVPSSPESIHKFYKTQSKALKWTGFLHSSFTDQTGFQPSNEEYAFEDFDGEQVVFLCDRDQATEIVLQTWKKSPGITRFRADLRPRSDNCKINPKAEAEMAEFQASIEEPRKQIPIPVLAAPANTVVNWQGDGGGGDYFYSSAVITTDAPDSTSLAMNYEQQMQQAGWVSQARYAASLVYLSVWQMVDKQGNRWHALLKFTRPQTSSKDYSADLTLFRDTSISPIRPN